MNVRSFERLVATYGAPAASLDAITRHLRAMDLLPVGGRGPNAPDVTAEAAALILLVLAGVTNPNSREQVVTFLSGFGYEEGPHRKPNAVVELLSAALADPAAAATVEEIRVCRGSGDVTVITEGGSAEAYRSLSDEQLQDQGAERAGFRVEGVLSRSLLMRASLAVSAAAKRSAV